jgi:hypothetical protein
MEGFEEHLVFRCESFSPSEARTVMDSSGMLSQVGNPKYCVKQCVWHVPRYSKGGSSPKSINAGSSSGGSDSN